MLFLYIVGCQQDNIEKEHDVEPIKQVEHWCDGALGGEKSTAYWQQDFARAHVGQRLFSPTGDWLSADEILSAELIGVGKVLLYPPENIVLLHSNGSSEP